MRVLIADDSPADVELMTLALQESVGHLSIDTATTTAEAFAILETAQRRGAPPDLILVDFHLAGDGGLRFLERVKAEAGTRRIPVVVLSGSDAPEAIAESYDRHANAYVCKPMDFSGLVSVLSAAALLWGRGDVGP